MNSPVSLPVALPAIADAMENEHFLVASDAAPADGRLEPPPATAGGLPLSTAFIDPRQLRYRAQRAGGQAPSPARVAPSEGSGSTPLPRDKIIKGSVTAAGQNAEVAVLIDTGAAVTTIDVKLAKALGLISPKTAIESGDSTSASLPRLEAAGISMSNLPVRVASVETDEAQIRLGMDAINGAGVAIGPKSIFYGQITGAMVMPVLYKDGVPMIDIKIIGESGIASTYASLETGAPSTLMPRSVARGLGLRPLGPEKDPVSGVPRARYVLLRQLAVGRLVHPYVVVQLIDTDRFVIGADLMSILNITLAQRDKVVSRESRPLFAMAKDLLRNFLRTGPDGVAVVHARPLTPSRPSFLQPAPK